MESILPLLTVLFGALLALAGTHLHRYWEVVKERKQRLLRLISLNQIILASIDGEILRLDSLATLLLREGPKTALAQGWEFGPEFLATIDEALIPIPEAIPQMKSLVNLRMRAAELKTRLRTFLKAIEEIKNLNDPRFSTAFKTVSEGVQFHLESVIHVREEIQRREVELRQEIQTLEEDSFFGGVLAKMDR